MTIKVMIGDIFEPPNIRLEICFEDVPDEMQQTALKELLDAWYLVGANRGFGSGFFHGASPLVFDAKSAVWHVDIGSASSNAIEVLTNCLEGYSEAQASIQEVILGTRLG
jgi:hypothetical protein